jgi:hypothetical protein
VCGAQLAQRKAQGSPRTPSWTALRKYYRADEGGCPWIPALLQPCPEMLENMCDGLLAYYWRCELPCLLTAILTQRQAADRLLLANVGFVSEMCCQRQSMKPGQQLALAA